ncbi:MAG: zf-HC2 domain-containing protein [Elusimicrobiota bacterium]
MNCPEFESLSAYIDGEAAPGEAGLVKTHLDGCARCRLTLRTLRTGKASLRALPVPAMPSDLRAVLGSLAPRPLGRGAQAWKGSAPRRGPAATPEAGGFWRTVVREVRAGLAHPVSALSFAAVASVALFFWARGSGMLMPRLDLPADLLMAAHNQYALTVPLAPADKILTDLPRQLAAAGAEERDVY